MDSSYQRPQLAPGHAETRFPEELWDMIAACTDQSARKNLRLCCKTLSRITTPHLFRTVCFHHNVPKPHLRNVMWRSSIQEHVRSLLIYRGDLLHCFRDDFGVVRNPFVNLTIVNCTIYFNAANTSTSPNTFWKFLLSAENLEVLQIEDRQFFDLLQPFRPGKTFGDVRRWRRLHTIKLQASIAGVSLLTFLSHLALTLRSLTLINCTLSLSGDPWPRVLDQARSMLSLENIQLENLEDITDTYLPFRKNSCDIITNFQQKIFDYMLKKTDVRPEWDETEVLKIHMNLAGVSTPEGHSMECLENIRYSQKFEELTQI